MFAVTVTTLGLKAKLPLSSAGPDSIAIGAANSGLRKNGCHGLGGCRVGGAEHAKLLKGADGCNHVGA